MSRSISVWYSQDGKDVDIDVGHMDLLGTQSASMEFWNMQKLRDLGLKELTILGRTDPVSFNGWEALNLLEKEIEILEANKMQIDYNYQMKDRWIGNLRFCFDKLVKLAPKDAMPHFMIG